MLRLCRIVIEEYIGLGEKVIIESPFAQITEHGQGVKQVQLALTRKYLLIGEDYFNKEETQLLSNVYFKPDIEPETESMRLTEIIPLKAIRIKIYRRGNREFLKIIAGKDTKVIYFEFGGHLLKRMYWIIWKDRIQRLKVSFNKYSKLEPYIDPYTDPETPFTSNSEYEMPKKIQVFADVHLKYKKVQDTEKLRELRNINDDKCYETKSSIQDTIQTIQKYFVDALTNSRLKILNKKGDYNVLKANSDHDYVIDLRRVEDFTIGGGTLNRKSISTGLIRDCTS